MEFLAPVGICPGVYPRSLMVMRTMLIEVKECEEQLNVELAQV